MKTLESAKRCQVIANELMSLNQESFVRDEKLNPIDIKWDSKKHRKMFGHVYELQNELSEIIKNLAQL